MSGLVVYFGGQGPLASSPRLVVSNSPSCPASFLPQHLRVASSCIWVSMCVVRLLDSEKVLPQVVQA